MPLLSASSGNMNEIIKYFGMPDNILSFTIKAELNAIVEVTCTYYPNIDTTEVLTKRYNLVEIDETEGQ